MIANHVTCTPRLATLARIKSDVLPGYFDELPSDETLRNHFRAAGIPFIKRNRAAKRGGGPVFWEISAIERYLKAQLKSGGKAK